MVEITKEFFDNLEVDEREVHYYNAEDYDSPTWDNVPELSKSTVIVLEPGQSPKIVDSTGKSYEDFIYKTQEERERDGLEAQSLNTWTKVEDGKSLMGDDMTIFYDSKSGGEVNFTVKSSSFYGIGELKGHLSEVGVVNIRGTAVIAVYHELMKNVTITQEHVNKIKEKFSVHRMMDGTTTYVLGK